MKNGVLSKVTTDTPDKAARYNNDMLIMFNLMIEKKEKEGKFASMYDIFDDFRDQCDIWPAVVARPSTPNKRSKAKEAEEATKEEEQVLMHHSCRFVSAMHELEKSGVIGCIGTTTTAKLQKKIYSWIMD